MLGLFVIAIALLGPLIILAFHANRRGGRESLQQRQHTMLYAPGDADIAAEAYHPARKDGAMPFPLGKKKERKRTETFRKHS